MPTSCRQTSTQTVCMSSFSRHTDVVIALRQPSFAYLTILLLMIDGGNNAILVLLDLSAAFDTLDHTLLLQRLHAEIGLDGSALDWFSSYLSCRSQQVLVGHALSAETPLLCGVPQGSVLGLLLFSLYTRQLADLIDKFCTDYHFFLPTIPNCTRAYQLNLSLR